MIDPRQGQAGRANARPLAGEPIPFLNLAATNTRLADRLMPVWNDIVRSAGFIGGPHVAEFESEFAAYTGARHAIGVANGTDALIVALLAMGVGPGDEVIAPAHTFVATVEAIDRVGATPVLADVDPATATLDPAAAAGAVTDRTKVIMPVHLYGQPADMAGMRQVAADHSLLVLEDAAQAHGASFQGAPVGSLGDAAAFSFYPGKNLGANGDAGAITTNDDALAERIRQIGNHGQSEKYLHVHSGVNSRLDAVQAAALTMKLHMLDEFNKRRVEVADLYSDVLADIDIERPVVADDRSHVFHLYVVRHPERMRLLDALSEAGVGVGLHYPTPVHLQPAFLHLGHEPGAFPHSEAWASECLSLPMCPELTDDQVREVAYRIRDVI